MTQYDLNLTQSAFVKSRGDLVLYGSWHGKKLRPCLVVLPANRSNAVPLVIEVDDAWKWNPDDLEVDARRNAQLIGQFLVQNNMDFRNAFTSMRVVSFIHDHLGDLLRIPPKNAAEIVVADAIRTDRSTGKVSHQEIIQRV